MTSSEDIDLILRRFLPYWSTDQAISMHVSKVGLINETCIISINEEPTYVLQKININVFKDVHAIDHNLSLLYDHIHHHSEATSIIPQIILPVSSNLKANNDNDFNTLTVWKSGYYRLFSFVKDSISLISTESIAIVKEAARLYGRYLAIFSTFDSQLLRPTIPDFHNLSLRYQQYLAAKAHGNIERTQKAATIIDELSSFDYIHEQYTVIVTQRLLPLRVVHHDAKLSNILFHQAIITNRAVEESLAVIDLDTTIAGYLISDLGDMFRTMLCPYDENEVDLSSLTIRMDMFAAIVEGYLTSEVRSILTPLELQHIIYSGEYIIYMQCLRFLTDYLLGDVYYPIDYPDHNYHRACNQCRLLVLYSEKKDEMQRIVDDILQSKCTFIA